MKTQAPIYSERSKNSFTRWLVNKPRYGEIQMKQLLEQWEKKIFGNNGAKTDSLLIQAMVLKHDNLLAFVDGALGANKPSPDRTFCELVLTRIGPVDAISVPKTAIDGILTIVNSVAGNSPKHYTNSYLLIADIAIAIGCGWKQEISDKWLPPAWSNVYWNRAKLIFTNKVASSVRNSLKQVHEIVEYSLTFETWLTKFFKDVGIDYCVSEDWEGFTIIMAGQMIYAKCDCGKHLKTCPKACVNKCCQPRHNLINWDPNICKLPAFIMQAVKGSADDLKSTINELSSSMLYPTLIHGRLAIIDKLYKICHCCNEKYYGEACTKNAQFDPTKTKLKNQSWLLQIPKQHFENITQNFAPPRQIRNIEVEESDDWLTVFERANTTLILYCNPKREKGGCDNYYDATLNNCPLCGIERSQRLSKLTIYKKL